MSRMTFLRKPIAVLSIFAVLALVPVITGCGDQEDMLPEENVKYEIALVSDHGLIMDGGHSEVAWNTITEFGGSNGISHKYYKASESSDGAFTDTIITAINKGAKIVIIDNSTMQQAVYEMQEKYPEINFVIIDADPCEDESGESKLESNSVAVSFDSGQAGFLAGYAAVMEGYTQLGFIGESERKYINDFGYGYVKGADRAAYDMETEVEMKYVCCSEEQDDEDIYKLAADMYENGTEVIFAAGTEIQEAVIEAAEAKDGKVIGSITDQSAKSDKVITSATFGINEALKSLLKQYKDKKFPGGQTVVYNAHNEGIRLELKNNKLRNLVQSQYEFIYDGLADGEIKVRTDRINSVKDIRLHNLTVQ